MSKTFSHARSAFKAGRFNEAANLLREALRRSPDHAPSFHLLGVIEAKQRRFEIALKCFDAAFNLDPRNASYVVDRANVIASMGNPQGAIAAYDRALEMNPRLAEALSNRGQALRLLGRSQDAAASFRRAVGIKPDFVDAHYALASTLSELEDRESAIKSFTQTLLLNPAHIPALIGRGTCQAQLRRWGNAEKDFKIVIDLVPEHFDAHQKRAEVLLELDQFSMALSSADRAVALQPSRMEGHLFRGKALHGLDRLQEALREFEITRELTNGGPESMVCIGAVYQALGDHERAVEYFDQGIRLNPGVAIWFYNRGVSAMQLRRYEEAIASFDEAIARDPDHAAAHWNSALCYLTLGDPKGWELYEWRWKIEKGGPDPKLQPRRLARWQGFQSLSGKNILLTSEQGLGDTLMFCRFVPLVAERAAQVSLVLPKGLIRLLSPLPGVYSVISRDSPQKLVGFDYFCPLMSLPKIFSMTFENIPQSKEPYLFANPALIETWRAKLTEVTRGDRRPRVGLMWSGRALVKTLGVRSMKLTTLLKVCDAKYQCVSLQKDLPSEDIELLRAHGIPHFEEEQQDFADAAAIVELCDVVVTIDTSIAHLAGALGKDTWVMLQYSAEWRWLLDRNDSPWYPKARLFRQPTRGDWESVVAEVKQALLERF